MYRFLCAYFASMIAKISFFVFKNCLESSKKVSNNYTAKITRPTSSPENNYLTCFLPFHALQNDDKFPKRFCLFSNCTLCRFFMKTKTKRGKVCFTYPKDPFLPKRPLISRFGTWLGSRCNLTVRLVKQELVHACL